jgi:LacI family transcriptional regulator
MQKETETYSSTIADVARMAGVSISTVSRVVNGSAPVDESTAERVRAAIVAKGYVPHTAARNLARRSTNTLALLLPSIGEDFFSLMMRGIEEAATAAGYDLLIATQSSMATHREEHMPFGRHNADGLIVFTGNLQPNAILPLYRSHFPIVLLYETAPQDLELPAVTVENKDGSRKLVEHLIMEHGYRRIGFLRGPENNQDSYWRELGYREALQNHGIPFDPTLVADGNFTENSAQQVVMNWVTDGVKPDAIFGGSDEGAFGALLALKSCGLQVPGDIAVVGFDDLTLARHVDPPLTTVRAPTELVGRSAVQQLLKLIRKEPVELLTLLPTELVIRQSCGCK